MPLDQTQQAAWLARVNADPEFIQAGRWTDFTFGLASEEQTRLAYRIRASVLEAEPAAEAPVTLRGSHAAWADFLQAVPRPPNHHILGMDRRRDDFAVEGDRNAMIRHLRVLSRALELMRG